MEELHVVQGVDHFHGWSGWGCMQTADESSCKTGIGGTAIGAQFIMIIMIIAPRPCITEAKVSHLLITRVDEG